MRLLAIDTAAEACTVAIGDGGRIVVRSEVIGRGHAEKLAPLVEGAMAEAGLAFADLDRIAVTTGPGSFAGLRVGIAAARGFALVTGAPAIGLGTLDVHAETARRLAAERGETLSQPVLALLVARGDELYGQLFAPDGTAVDAATAAPAADFAALAARSGALLAGAGADLLAPFTAASVLHRRSAVEPADLLALAARTAVTGAPPKPLYVKPPDARPHFETLPARA